MEIKNTVSIDFCPRSSIVDSVFDCRLPGVDKQSDIIDAFNTSARYWDDILNIANIYIDVSLIITDFLAMMYKNEEPPTASL